MTQLKTADITVWVVERYVNHIREKRRADYEKQAAFLGGIHADPAFATRLDAIEFMVKRAEKAVIDAEEELRCAKNSLRRLLRKYAVVNQVSEKTISAGEPVVSRGADPSDQKSAKGS